MTKYYKYKHIERCECGGLIETKHKTLYKKWSDIHKNCSDKNLHESSSSHERRPEYKFIGFIPDPEEYAASTQEDTNNE